MAKKQLTLEEKIQTALVPEEEQPYKVPKNWCWVRLGAVCSFVGGGTPSKQNPEFWNGDISWASVKDIKGDYLFETIDSITDIGCQNSATNICEENDLLLVTRIEPGKTIISKIRTAINQDIKIVKSELPAEHLHYFFKTFRYEFIQRASGSTVKGINIPSVQNVPLPLPPQKEFNRIVARIESLFRKLDEAKDKIQEVLEGADLRRAAILHQAFTGKLTEKWRRENNVSDDSREKYNVKSICNSLKYGTAKKSVQHGKVVVLRMGNLQKGEIDWESLVYSNDQDDIEKYSLNAGDVLFNRTNSAELVGKTSIYRGERPAIYAGYLIKLDYKHDKIIGDYFNYMLNSPKAKEYCNKVKTDGVNQSNINAQKIGAFEFDVPTIPEQQEIVRLLNNMLTHEKATQSACESAFDTIDKLQKSILARAFRGKLGTNDPSEASAKELLQEILAS